MSATHFSGGAVAYSDAVKSSFENNVLISVSQDDVVGIKKKKKVVVMQIVCVYTTRGRISL